MWRAWNIRWFLSPRMKHKCVASHHDRCDTLSVKPSSGTGVPQLRSRVMQRVFRPLFSQDSAMLFAFDVHVPSTNTVCRWAFKRSDSCKQQQFHVNSCLRIIKIRIQCLWCSHRGTAIARVHPVHLTNVAHSARWLRTFEPSQSAWANTSTYRQL